MEEMYVMCVNFDHNIWPIATWEGVQIYAYLLIFKALSRNDLAIYAAKPRLITLRHDFFEKKHAILYVFSGCH